MVATPGKSTAAAIAQQVHQTALTAAEGAFQIAIASAVAAYAPGGYVTGDANTASYGAAITAAHVARDAARAAAYVGLSNTLARTL